MMFEFVGTAGGSWTVGAAYLTSDVGAFAGLPVGLTSKAGYTSLYSSKYEVSGHAYERTLVRSNIAGNGFYFNLDFDTAMLDVGFNMDAGGTDAAPAVDYGVLLTVPEVGPGMVEAFYMVADNHEFKGKFGVDGSADFGVASAAAGFMYDVLNETWAYGVGASAPVSMATIGVSLNGNDTDTLNQLGFDVNLALADAYGLDAGLGLSMAEGAETFQGADISAYYQPGASKWVVGYLITETGYTYAAPANSAAEGTVADPLGGGLFLKCDIDF
ncbi:MAG: hypothetical protein ACOC7U_03745 [Spirochaetota bacterium]